MGKGPPILRLLHCLSHYWSEKGAGSNNYIYITLEACADTHFLAKVIKAYGDLRGQIFAAWCEDRLEPGRAWSNTAVALWTSPVRKPVSGLVALTTVGIATECVYLLYTGKIPGGVRIPVITSP